MLNDLLHCVPFGWIDADQANDEVFKFLAEVTCSKINFLWFPEIVKILLGDLSIRNVIIWIRILKGEFSCSQAEQKNSERE